MSISLKPLAAGNRDVTLDVLRGFALAGVLFVFCAGDIGAPAGYTNSFLDELIAWPKFVLVEGRMYTMLIVIFGIGFHVQLKKAQQQDTSLVPVFTRRIIGLIVIGFIHAIVLSKRDILLFYGVAGAVLLLLRNASNRQLVFWLVIIFLLLITPTIFMVFGNPFPAAHALVEPNNYREHIQYNWAYFKLYHQGYFIYVDMLFHFLLGFLISKAGIFQKIKSNTKFRRSLLLISFAGTIILIPIFYYWILEVVEPIVYSKGPSVQQFFILTAIRIIWPVWMMVSVTLYATILIGLLTRYDWKKRLKPLAAFGQMALSNYLVQSIILVPALLISDHYHNVPPFQGFILFLIVFSFQLFFSSWWMTRFTLGPFEWLLRSFTYWKWQPLRQVAASRKYKPIRLRLRLRLRP